ncbi:MAG: HlyD family efflux transporter periplasmic adaptor subunit, partial [Clostridia bacterium]|nr:HlyD family efflux transporter periplasmic adaptor subunit [Clostridia bacterium]
MENKAQNRRDWVKNIAIIFLVILLLLTFFSRTIMNARLPEVSAQYAQYATLSSAVKASGTVKANESYNVIFEEEEKVEQTRKVQSVYVKAGDTVEKDAPILALSNDPSEQLKQAREDLAKAEEELVKLKESGNVDGMTSDKTLIDAQRKIDKAEDKLKELEAEYKSVLAGGDPATVIKDAVKSLNEQIKDLEAQKKQAGSDIDAQKKQASKNLDAQKKQAEKDIDAQIKAVDKRISELNTKISEITGKLTTAEAMIEEDILSDATTQQKLAEAEAALSEAQRTFENSQASYDALKAEEDNWQEMVDMISGAIGDVEKANTLTNEIRTLETKLDGLYLSRDRKIEDHRKALDAEYTKNDPLYIAYSEAKYKYDQYRNAYQSEIDRLEGLEAELGNLAMQISSYQEIENQYRYYESEEERLHLIITGDSELSDERWQVISDEYERVCALHKQYKSDFEAIEQQYLSLQDQIKNINSEISTLTEYKTNLSTLETAVETAQTAIDKAEKIERVDETDFEREIDDLDRQISDTITQIEDAKAKLYVIDMPEVDDVIHYEFDYDLEEAKANLDKAKANAETVKTELADAEKKRDDAKAAVDALTKQSKADSVAAGYRAELNGLKAELEQNEAAKTRYEESKLESSERYEDAKASSDERYDNSRTSSDDRFDERIEALREKITEKNEELADVPKKRDPDEVKKEIEEQKETIEDLKETFKITEGTEDNTKAERERGIEKAEKEVKDLKEKVKLYEGLGDQKNVTAPIAGRIVSVNFVPGDTVTSGATVASIEIADKGYIVELSMSAEEARRIQVGSPVTVTNSWWYSNISASIAQVKSDPKSQGKNRIIVMDVTGDVSEGQ